MSVVSEATAFWEAQGLTVFDGPPPKEPPTHYVCIYTDDGTLAGESLAPDPDRSDWALRTLSVGQVPDQARWVRRRVRRIVGQVIAGCVVTHEFANPLVPDNDVPGALLSAYDQFALTTPPEEQ